MLKTHRSPQPTLQRAPPVSRNERALLELVWRRGSISRTVLAREMSLSVPSVSRLTEGLIERGLLRFGNRLSDRGNPASGYGVELEPHGAYALGVSVMTDALSMTLVNLRGEILEDHMEPLPDVRSAPVLARIKALAEGMLARHVTDRSRLLGAGVAITGFFVDDRHSVNPPPPLDEFALVDIQAMFSAQLGLPVIVENDGSAAALAESFLGVGGRYRNFAYLHFSAGLGGGIIINGELLRGVRGNAGEVSAALPQDQVDDRPTLTLLLEMMRAAGSPATSLSEMLSDFDPRAPGVDAWVERGRRPLETIVNALDAIVNPDAIVLGGRLPRPLAQRLIAAIPQSRLMRRETQWNLAPVLPAEVTGDATSLGAAMLQLQWRFFGKSFSPV